MRRFILSALFTAFCLSVASAQANDSRALPTFDNVKVGEAPGVSRVIVMCGRACAAQKQPDGRFYLSGVSGALDIDMREAGKFVSALNILDLRTGAVLSVDTAAPPIRSEIAPCGQTTVCVDFYHPAGTVSPDVAPASLQGNTQTRQASAPEMARRAAPEQSAPAQRSRALGDEVKSHQETVAHKQKTALLEMPADTQACTAYYQRLQQNGWDMAAYKKVALCAASAGDIARARDLFERYLKAFPDDAEAVSAYASLAPAKRNVGAAAEHNMRYGF
ncbi:tetratricopeptide repeat protein [Parvularcula sp. IMCC14364]|uniref:tetratricopeptide repeat protein n=1 Tax=Parvularcula sp. IMCC14364 TaxID=3067902 RepID=UPI0027428862|nr:tetratricopeptide repeat protein [Parvularcula sp. IMCC14364]